jgi:two-component system sensor histidine kinase HydH
MKKRFWVGIFSWFIIGALLIFAPLIMVMTMRNLEIQKDQTTRLLVGTGEGLIRSFEAGARTGAGLNWSAFQLQKLLVEMAQQPGIDYIIVVDTDGVIVADSDPSRLGEIYGTDLDLHGLAKTKEIASRQVGNTVGADTFEVYRQFKPTQEPFAGFQGTGEIKRKEGLVIFVGLDMGPILTARQADEEHTIWMAVILLLIGCSGFISLFVAYRYRTARRSLSRIQAFSDHLVESMPIGIIVVDNSGRLATFNSSVASILNLPISEVLGRPAKEILPPVCSEVIGRLRIERKVIEEEMECPTHDGRIVPLDVIASILAADGDDVGFVILFRDMTEIQFLKKEIIRSQHLAALGNLAAGVAHEIRNPLSSIKGFATYFKERYRDIPQDKQTAEIMVAEVERVNRVISQLLEFARPITLNRQKTPLASLIAHTLRMVEDQAQTKGITLDVGDFADTSVFIDPDKIKQVLLNLFLNAMAAMADGGVLSVRSGPGDHRFIRLLISDTGAGIRKENLNRVFDPYFTTKPSGTGLGLAIVQKIMEAHNGGISIESDEGKGTTVTLALPAALPPSVGEAG